MKHLYFVIACLVFAQATFTKPDQAYNPYFWSLGIALFAYLISEVICSSLGWLEDRKILHVLVQSVVGVVLFFCAVMSFAFLGKEFESLYKLLNTMSFVREDVFLVLYGTLLAGLGEHLTNHIIGRAKAPMCVAL